MEGTGGLIERMARCRKISGLEVPILSLKEEVISSTENQGIRFKNVVVQGVE